MQRMKIAFITYEYPPDTSFGGIATYVQQAARMLAVRGHHVEVIAGSPTRNASALENNVHVHRVRSDTHEEFNTKAGQIFADRHREAAFDVLEGPDAGADAAVAVKRVPEIPLVLKLHTPGFLVDRVNCGPIPPLRKLRIWLGAKRRGIKPFYQYSRIGCHEYHHSLEADVIAAPSRSIGEIMTREWSIPSEILTVFPLPFIPDPEYLQMPIDTSSRKIFFIGRLEPRKGIYELADAIPRVVGAYPSARFIFVGRPITPRGSSEDTLAIMKKRLTAVASSVEFCGGVPLNEVPAKLREADICVFPSRWENFPLVCLEAMAAGKAVVGSKWGGMADMIEEGVSGCLVNPYHPREIAGALLDLLRYGELRKQMGEAARRRVLGEFSLDAVVPQQEACYEKAIRRRRERGPRSGIPIK